MGKNQNITLNPEKIRFTRTCIKIIDSIQGGCKIPYKELVMASLKTRDKESGIWYEPEIMEITKGMDGNLILFDTSHCRWNIKTERLERTAEDMLSELAVRAPYILIGAQPWLDETDEEAFSEIKIMTGLMREC